MRILQLCLLLILLTVDLCLAQKAGRRNRDPGPDEYVMMDIGAELDKASLMRNFVYPDSARHAGIQGTVTVKVLIGTNNKAERVIIEEGVHPLLDSAAARAAMLASYTSAFYDSEAIKTWMEFPITFSLGKERPPEVEVEGEPEGDGFTQAKFDTAEFYSQLDSTVRRAASRRPVSVIAVIDVKGRCTNVINSSQSPDEIFDALRDILRATSFTPARRGSEPSDDTLTITINASAR